MAKKAKKNKDVLNQKIEKVCSLFCIVSLVAIFIMEWKDRLEEKKRLRS